MAHKKYQNQKEMKGNEGNNVFYSFCLYVLLYNNVASFFLRFLLEKKTWINIVNSDVTDRLMDVT